MKTAICGGIAGVTLWTAIFPTDVLKSRIQVAGSTEPMIFLLKHIYRTEGMFLLTDRKSMLLDNNSKCEHHAFREW